MESKKFQLNPNAPVFIPSSRMASYGRSGSHDDTPLGLTSYVDSYAAQTGVFQGEYALPDNEEFDSEEDFSNMAQEFLESTEDPVFLIEPPPDDAVLVRSMAAKFPGYSHESILDVYAANGGDMEATVEMLTQLENFSIVGNLPETLVIGDESTSCLPDDKKNPTSSSDPVSSSGH